MEIGRFEVEVAEEDEDKWYYNHAVKLAKELLK